MIRTLKTGSRERKGGKLLPERIGIPTPYHIRIDKERPVKDLELVEVVLEAHDGSMVGREVLQNVELIVQSVPMQKGPMRVWAEESNRPIGIVSSKRTKRGHDMLYISFGAVAVKNVPFARRGHRYRLVGCILSIIHPQFDTTSPVSSARPLPPLHPNATSPARWEECDVVHIDLRLVPGRV